ncbi:MAG: 3'-5' exonuclease [Gemmatimonadaceae bacterium]
MIKLVHKEVWAFDAEWVPDPLTGRLVYDIGDDVSDEDVVSAMWRNGGASPENPRPYIKTVLCRVVSVAFVRRKVCNDGRIDLELKSLPTSDAFTMAEGELLDQFLRSMGKHKPQLVGFNSTSADLPILVQRAMVHALRHKEFCERPDKPWGGVDYFAKFSDWHLDLKDVVGSWGKSSPSLHELATSCGIPGKMETAGSDVIDLWRSGDVRAIVQYNECDALTTYLVWLRLVHLCGFFSSDQFMEEQGFVEKLLMTRGAQAGNAHLIRFLDHWRRLRALRESAEVARP